MDELLPPLVIIEAERRLVTPSIWLPNSDIDPDLEIDMEIERAIATRQMLEGKITWDEFEQVLDANDVDPIDAHETWENGLIYC